MNRELRKWTIVAMSVAFCFGIVSIAAASTMDDLQAAARRYGEFLEMPVKIS